jgi:hypothetical protein
LIGGGKRERAEGRGREKGHGEEKGRVMGEKSDKG